MGSYTQLYFFVHLFFILLSVKKIHYSQASV